MTSAPRPAQASRVPDELDLMADPRSGRTALSARTGSHLAATITDLAVRWDYRAWIPGHAAAPADNLRYAPYVTLTEDVARRDFFDRVRRGSWGLLGPPRLRWACVSEIPIALRAELAHSKRLPLTDDALIGLSHVDNPSRLPNDAVGVCVVSAWAVPLTTDSPAAP